MRWLFSIRRTTSAFVTLALLWTSLMPSVALALQGPPGTGNTWVEVCTSRGILVVKLPQPAPADRASLAQQESPAYPAPIDPAHCPYCHLPAHDAWLASAAPWVFTPVPIGKQLAREAPAYSAQPLRWSRPAANAPPV